MKSEWSKTIQERVSLLIQALDRVPWHDWVESSEAAYLYGITPRQLWERARRGAIPSLRWSDDARRMYAPPHALI